MPELPEAETIARRLRQCAAGRTIRRVRVVRPDVVAGDGAAFRRALDGRRILEIARRGKNVILGLDGHRVLAINLGMTGRLLFLPGAPRAAGPAHAAVIFHLEPDGVLVYDDARRFGRLEVLDPAGWAARCARLGPEPLDPAFTPRVLGAILKGSRAPIRSLLLDQRRIAGIGNIYANEALFAAGIHPARPAASLAPNEVRRLHGAIRRILARAIEARGSTIRDYRDADGSAGGFAPRLRVYGREGSACPRCAGTIERLMLAGRSAFLCPRCQPGNGWA